MAPMVPYAVLEAISPAHYDCPYAAAKQPATRRATTCRVLRRLMGATSRHCRKRACKFHPIEALLPRVGWCEQAKNHALDLATWRADETKRVATTRNPKKLSIDIVAPQRRCAWYRPSRVKRDFSRAWNNQRIEHGYRRSIEVNASNHHVNAVPSATVRGSTADPDSCPACFCPADAPLAICRPVVHVLDCSALQRQLATCRLTVC